VIHWLREGAREVVTAEVLTKTDDALRIENIKLKRRLAVQAAVLVPLVRGAAEASGWLVREGQKWTEPLGEFVVAQIVRVATIGERDGVHGCGRCRAESCGDRGRGEPSRRVSVEHEDDSCRRGEEVTLNLGQTEAEQGHRG
jgi:hypothetical protein